MQVNIRVVDIRFDDYDLYIGRENKTYYLKASKWANPFVIRREVDRASVLEKYRIYVLNNPELYNSLEELNGKTLGCWCVGKKCHGHILKELLEEKYRKND